MTGLVDDFSLYILMLDGGVVMILFLYSFSLLYLILHPKCFEVEQICFSRLMLYFDEIDVLAFAWFLLAIFVCPYFFFFGICWDFLANIMFKLIESCRQAGFQLVDSVEAAFVLLFYFFPKVLQGICHFISYYIQFFLSFRFFRFQC